MKAKKYWILITTVGICLAGVSAVKSSEDKRAKASAEPPPRLIHAKRQRDTLVGLKGVGVGVEYIRPEVQRYGLTERILQTDVEMQLRQNGIRVLSMQETLQTPGCPYLYIRVEVLIKEEIKLAAVGIRAEFAQVAFLMREPTIFADATTWDKTEVGMVPVNQLKDVRKDVKDLVDHFIKDYLAANAKEQKDAKKQSRRDRGAKEPERIEAKVGQDFVITLASNPSTGYSWRLAERLPSMLKLQSKRYIPPKVQIIGGGGTEEWTFKSVRSGRVTIILEYVRPWEKNSPPAKQRIFSIVAK